jgi:Flp pilus assembly pilin Flp
MKKNLLRLWKEEVAQDLVEYALLMLLVGLGAVASLRGAGTKVANAFTSAGTTISVNAGGGNNGGGNGGGNNGGGDNGGGGGDGGGGNHGGGDGGHGH